MSSQNAYTAPGESPNYKKLLYLVDVLGGDQELLRDVLWQLNVPGHLEHFGWVVLKLERLLGHRQDLEKAFAHYGDPRHPPDFGFFYALQTWCSFYSEHRAAIDGPMGELFAVGPSTTKNPLQNRGMSRYGLYAALLCIPEDVSVQPTWEKVALRFLLAHQIRMRAWPREGYEAYSCTEESPDLPIKIYPPSRQLRYLTQRQYTPLLRELSDELLVKSGVLLEELNGHEGGKLLRSLLTYMEKAERNVAPRESPGLYHKTDTALGPDMTRGLGYVEIDERVALSPVDVDIDDPWVADLPLTIVDLYQGGSEVNPRELALIDLLPGEVADGDALSLVDQPCGEAPSRFSTALAARARQKHLALQAQQLPWRYSNLSLFQLSFIHRKLTGSVELYSRKMEREKSEELIYQTSLILLVMLWTGSPMERAIDISIHHTRAEFSNASLGFYEHKEGFDGVRYEWRFQALEPRYLHAPEFDVGAFRKKNPSFWLPDSVGVVPLLVAFQGQMKRKRGGKLFREPLETYRDCAKELLKAHGAREEGSAIRYDDYSKCQKK